MRVIHFERTSGTGHVLPWCGVWGSMDTDWTAEGAGVTCGPCRDAMRDGAPDVRAEEASTGGDGRARSDGRRARARA